MKDRMPMGYWNQSPKDLAVNHPKEAANSASGYIRVSRNNVIHYLHRWLWEQLIGPIPAGYTIDHINGKRTDCQLTNMRCVEWVYNLRNASMRVDNTSGVTGVSFWSAGNAWRAVVYDPITGKQKCKTFSLAKWKDMAFTMACDAREDMIQELNERGAGYTERHGK